MEGEKELGKQGKGEAVVSIGIFRSEVDLYSKYHAPVQDYALVQTISVRP